MYQIIRSSNDIVQLEERMFGDLGFRERDHLQEWIAKNPEVLGEELLIIQKEFDGFSDTNERLDLLALDKEGNIVVIENKLDDTGKDVVWQALKYASYCSTLSTSQIVGIFQKFLDKQDQLEDARTAIIDFMGIESEESMVLNRNDQRIMFVANHYRKEVTSTVLWLLDHDLAIQCFKVTPYSLGDDLFLQVDQIIPVPEVSEFIIDIKEKEKEDKGKSKKVAETQADLLDFWKKVKTRFASDGDSFFENISAKPYFDFGFTKGRGRFAMVIGRRATRIEIYFANDADKKIIDALSDYKNELNNAFDGRLEWQRLEGKKASRVKYEMTSSEAEVIGKWNDPSAREGYIDWFVTELRRFHSIVYPVWEKVQSRV